MKIKNNNQKILQRLARAEYRENKARNRLMILAIALSVVVVFVILSIMKGRIDTEYLREVREKGEATSAYLERPTQEQIAQIKGLSYIKEVGAISYFADAWAGKTSAFACIVADRNAYEKMYLLAYTDVHGQYPEKKDEVMISRRGLQEMGIKDPVLGMRIQVKIHTKEEKIKKADLRLSGYYTDYVNPMEGPPIGFFAKSSLEQFQIKEKKDTTLMMQGADLIIGDQIEQRLYEDIATRDEKQRFLCEDTISYRVILRTIGGYDVAAVLISLILISVFLLNYNIMNLSVNRQIQYYGLLKTLGTTNRQIRIILYRQIAKMVACGSGGGICIGSMLILWILPGILKHHQLEYLGVASKMIKFHWSILAITVGICSLIAFISILLPAIHAGRITPIESEKYVEHSRKHKRMRNRSKGKDQIKCMAWRNLTRSRHSICVMTVSMIIGLTTALISDVITKGLDISNNYDSEEDFYLEDMYTPLEGEEQEEGYLGDYQGIRKEEISYLRGLDGVENVREVVGAYASLRADEELWGPYIEGYINEYMKGMTQKQKKRCIHSMKEKFYSKILVVDDEKATEIEQYVKGSGQKVDIESFKKGEAAIEIDGVFFSEKLLKLAEQKMKDPFELQDEKGKSLGSLKLAGIIDYRKKDCPELEKSFMKLYGPDLIVTKQAAKRAGLRTKILEASIYVKEEKEPQIKAKIRRLLENKKNSIRPSEQGIKMPYIQIKSDGKGRIKEEIYTMRLGMYLISALLSVLGICQYLNITATGIFERREEFAMLEAVGITKRQLKKMLIWEGLYYSLILTVAISTIGLGSMYGTYWIIHNKIRYMRFSFPYISIGTILAAIYLICIIVPNYMYRKVEGESVIQRLQKCR